jgi:hypothetical protein
MPRKNSDNDFLVGIEAVEKIDISIEGLKAELKELKGYRKIRIEKIRQDTGIIPLVTQQMIHERRMDPPLRQSFATQVEVARAMLGMLDGTPLGDHARKAFDPPPPRGSDTRIEDPDQGPLPDMSDPPEPNVRAEPTAADIDVARQAGREAARSGGRIGENTYPADPAKLRAAWDEGFCRENGSTGMEIPEELRRKEKKKKGDDDAS